MFFEIQGLGSLSHTIFTLSGILIVILMVIFTRKRSNDTILKIIRILGVVLVIFEITKIVVELNYGFPLDSVVPLYYCSMLVYVIPFTIITNQKIKDYVLGVLMLYGLIPGIAYLIYPVTALVYHPLLSLSTLHSLFYHCSMIYISLIIMIKKMVNMNLKKAIFASFVPLFFCIVVLILNITLDHNYMFSYYAPETIPALVILENLVSKYVYPALVILTQTVLSYIVTHFFYLGIQKSITQINENKGAK